MVIGEEQFGFPMLQVILPGESNIDFYHGIWVLAEIGHRYRVPGGIFEADVGKGNGTVGGASCFMSF